jgi:hypothetical protein
LAPVSEQLAVRGTFDYFRKIDRAGNEDGQTDIEWEKAGQRSLGTPTDANLDTAVDSNERQERHKGDDPNFNIPVGRARPTRFFYCLIHSHLM